MSKKFKKKTPVSDYAIRLKARKLIKKRLVFSVPTVTSYTSQGANQVEMRRQALHLAPTVVVEKSVAVRQHTVLQTQVPESFCSRKDARRLSKHLQKSLAITTVKRYATAWKVYCKWLSSKNEEGYDKFSMNWVHGIVISLYLSELLDDSYHKGIGPNKLMKSVAAIRYHYEVAGFSTSPLTHPWCSRIVSTAKKLLVPQKFKRQAISVAHMKSLLNHHLGQDANQIDLRTLMHVVVLLLCFLGFLRFSDVVSILVHEDLLKFIKCPSGRGDEGMLIFIPKSKTDQSWRGAWVAIGATGGALCPVTWTRALLTRGRYVRSHSNLKVDCGPLLRAVSAAPRGHIDYPGYVLAQTTSNGIIAGLTHSSFLRSSRVLLMEAGIDIPFGLHSLRSGGATAASLNSIPHTLICQHGRWKGGSTMEDHYLKTHEVSIQKFFTLTRQIWQ